MQKRGIMIRLDKFLCDQNIGTRSFVKDEIRKGFVMVNNSMIKKPDMKIEMSDIVSYRGTVLQYQEFYYYMLHKPAGYVSTTSDLHDKTVIDLLDQAVPGKKSLFPVGRLDKDTEGLLLLTNDGALSHELLSPRKHIKKTYYAQLAFPLSEDAVIHLQNGVDIGEKKETLPAHIQKKTDKAVFITITEGKFHQIKRMFEAVGNQVLYLKRISMGPLILDENLEKGSFRTLKEDEIKALKENK